jgi:DNA-damage-inducible protein J
MYLEMSDNMESLILNVRVDANDKKNFEQFCSSVGMNVSTAVNMFIKAVLREQKLPFEVKSDKFDDTVYEKLKEAELEMENTSKRYTLEEIIDSMNNIIDRR